MKQKYQQCKDYCTKIDKDINDKKYVAIGTTFENGRNLGLKREIDKSCMIVEFRFHR